MWRWRTRKGLPAVLLSAPALLLAGGCESPVAGPAPVGVALAASRGVPGHDVPLRLTGHAVLVGQDFAPGFGPPTFGRSTFEGRCSVPADFILRFAMRGEATHLGRYTAELEHCTRVEFATGLTAVHDGEAAFTAADGDRLLDRYERLVPGSGSAGDPEHHRFVGGTGRFAGASGEGLLLTHCDRAAGTCDVELEGVISYDASDRRD